MLITQEFSRRIEAKIAEIEKQTSVEFVPVIVRKSSSYALFRVFLGTAVTAVVVFILSFSIAAPGTFFSAPHWDGVMALVTGLLVASLSSFPFLLKAFLPTSLKQRAVAQAAHLYFLSEEVFATRERTGVLIYISLLEEAVFILADKGLLKIVPNEKWQQLGVELARDFDAKRAGDTFLKTLDTLVAMLAPSFPPTGENPDELANRVRTPDGLPL